MDSLLSQTYSNLEIVVSEGGGSDDSAAYLATISDSRVQVIDQPPGTSAAQNWTAVSQAAGGEFTKLICQDDLIYPDAIAEQVQDLTRHPEAVMATAKRDIIDAHGTPIFRGRGLSGLKGEIIDGSDVIHACFRQGTNVIGEPLAVLFRTQALQDALPWEDENPLMLDLSMYSKVAPLGDVVARRESIGAFRVSNTSWSTRLAKEQLGQTRRWQNSYAATHPELITSMDKVRSTTGRHIQTNLRRIAYSYLDARSRL